MLCRVQLIVAGHTSTVGSVIIALSENIALLLHHAHVDIPFSLVVT